MTTELATMEIWDKVKRPPAEALKTIRAGRLKGMSDISPQWRYQIMTEVFGACGDGWWFTVQKLWSEDGADGVKFAFAHVNLFYMLDSKGPDGEYCASEPIPGIGGSTIVAKESAGLHSSDEGYKMAITDALSTAMKMLGVAADIYAGKWDGSKYKDDGKTQDLTESVPINKKQMNEIVDMLTLTESDMDKFLAWLKVGTLEEIPASRYKEIMGILEDKAKKAAA